MSTENPICKVCGQALVAKSACACAKCQTPSHAECFGYSGGCATYGCGSLAARFDSKPPEGWRENADGSWSVPATAVARPLTGPLMDASLDRFVNHWRVTAQLEFFVAVGQAWLAGFTLAMTLIGKWTLPLALQSAVGLVVLAHANTLFGLMRVGMTLTGGEDLDPAVAPRRALGMRAGTIARSRVLHAIATLLLVAGLATGGTLNPGYVRIVAIFITLVPWVSLNPRWGLERVLLRSVEARLPEGQRA